MGDNGRAARRLAGKCAVCRQKALQHGKNGGGQAAPLACAGKCDIQDASLKTETKLSFLPVGGATGRVDEIDLHQGLAVLAAAETQTKIRLAVLMSQDQHDRCAIALLGAMPKGYQLAEEGLVSIDDQHAFTQERRILQDLQKPKTGNGSRRLLFFQPNGVSGLPMIHHPAFSPETASR
ncbi:hypothetical protein NAC44_08610 [Allorhizobium sp. BGMRC 0089]|uniref:hypothetical protein n=1 Tax=Allorhizobium sonneratiae TaxID=2934936 RepID=UPI002033FF9D|nr:hypothetical protein [Allorhizobium sonneratiae]MCM2292390.1 hypothetical protein [Allorhizobium sonneratiae]